MKKRTLKTIACAAVMALALSVTACGGSDDDAKTNEETSAVVEDADSETEVETDTETDTDTDTDTDTEDAADDASAENEAESEADTSADNTGAYATLEDYCKDPAVKAELEASFESMAQDGMTLSIDIKENVLTMICKLEDSSFTTDEAKAQLSDGLDASSAVFEALAATLDGLIEQDPGTCTIILRYTDSDDNVLVEKEFKAQ